VLLWSELYWPYIGGAEIFAAKLMQSLRGRGIEFLVVTSHHDRELPDAGVHDGIPIRRLPFRAAIANRDVRSFARAMSEAAAIEREFAPDLIHVNAIGPSVMFLLRSRRAESPPYVVTVQQEVLPSQRDGSATLLAQALVGARHVVGVSRTVLDQLRAAHPEIADRSSVIFNGVDTPALAPAPLPETPHVLCLGRLVPAKGFDVALRAAALLGHVRMTIAGDGVMRGELMALAKELGVDAAFPGWIDPDDVPRLINEASVVVMPSRREGLGIVSVQAALMARPIIATPVGGLPEVVLDGESGILIPVDDAPTLAAALETLLKDREKATAMGRRGREHALAKLDWNATIASYDSLYRSYAQSD
jgi:glycogen(starch) synthase